MNINMPWTKVAFHEVILGPFAIIALTAKPKESKITLLLEIRSDYVNHASLITSLQLKADLCQRTCGPNYYQVSSKYVLSHINKMLIRNVSAAIAFYLATTSFNSDTLYLCRQPCRVSNSYPR